jgi:hypothetical protein
VSIGAGAVSVSVNAGVDVDTQRLSYMVQQAVDPAFSRFVRSLQTEIRTRR